MDKDSKGSVDSSYGKKHAFEKRKDINVCNNADNKFGQNCDSHLCPECFF